MIKNIDMIVFDMAGTTIVDKNEVEDCFAQAVRKTGLQATSEEINAMMGWSKLTVFETLWEKQLSGAPKEEIAQKIHASYDVFCEILETHYLKSDIFPSEGTMEVFEYLKRLNIKIALTTGFYRKVTDIILNKLGWNEGLDENYTGNGLINASISSDQVIAGRPAPFMIFRAMELCHVHDVRKIIKIGDTPSDLKAGRNAGCRITLGITNGTHSHEALSHYESDGLIGNMHEFKAFLEDQY